MPLTPDQLALVIERRDVADKDLRVLADTVVSFDQERARQIEALRQTLGQYVADFLHDHAAGGAHVPSAPTAFAKGTLVRLRTINGGDSLVSLVSDYHPGAEIQVARDSGGRAVTVAADRIASVEEVQPIQRTRAQEAKLEAEEREAEARADRAESRGGW